MMRHEHKIEVKKIRESIKKPVVKENEKPPFSVLNFRQRKLNPNDPIGNPVFFLRK